MPELKEEQVLSKELIEEYRNDILNDPVSNIAINACFKSDPNEICIRRDQVYEISHTFNHKVETESKPVTNQKSSGRCWIFACLNAMRVSIMKSLNIEDFEFSQTFLFFWDKIERSNYFLNRIVEKLRSGEEINGRLMSYLLHDPTCDGGQWDMLVNLIEKYGLMPKKSFPEAFCSENSGKMNWILEAKLREYSRDLHQKICVEKEDKPSVVSSLLHQQMKEVFRIVSICLGIPPKQFTFEYYDKKKKFFSVGPVTPYDFYHEHIKPVYNVADKVCLVNDPRPKNAYGKTYTIDCLGNMASGRPVVYNNQPIDVLASVGAESIKAGEAVWFGSDVSKRFNKKLGAQDLRIHDYKSTFGLDINLGMSKAERLLYGDSLMTHAMVFTAVHLDDNGKPSKWRVENSWGEDYGDKGYFILSADWFDEFVFEVVVDKKFVPEHVMKAFDSVPIVLPAWDPMGSLAKNN